ncbi:hypothetical protein ACHAXA_000680 [Cyclostephanos tholiformis]|uniref:Uncharacterized protein n=1 Tax=Cyclostephanos tholiformis TaxID=382380 RepID=A0ABD3R8V0_9STRA
MRLLFAPCAEVESPDESSSPLSLGVWCSSESRQTQLLVSPFSLPSGELGAEELSTSEVSSPALACPVALAYAIAPPAVTRELVATRVVRVNIPVLSKEEISQSAIKMEMKPNAPAGFPRSYPIRLDFAEVLGEPALKAFVRYTLDALAASSVPAPWHANAFFVRRRPVSIVRGPATLMSERIDDNDDGPRVTVAAVVASDIQDDDAVGDGGGIDATRTEEGATKPPPPPPPSSRYAELINSFHDAHDSWAKASSSSMPSNPFDDEDDDDDIDDDDDRDHDDDAANDHNVWSRDGASPSSESSSSIASLEDLSDALLRPGMKFLGSIFIPGTTTSAAHTNPAYGLTILTRDVDSLGNDFVLAMHRAHDDEQAVHVQVKIVDVVVVDDDDNHDNGSDDPVSRRLEIEYSDGETVCQGRWNPTIFRWEGRVHQRLHVNDGVFHTSDSATHVFTLYPCTFSHPFGREGIFSLISSPSLSYLERDVLSGKTRSMADHNCRTLRAKQETLTRFDELYRQMNITIIDIRVLSRYCKRDDCDSENANVDIHLDERQQALLKLRDCDWAEISNETIMLGERLCAEFRRRSSLLDDLSFETSKDREQFVNRWKAAKFDLVAAHASWDEWGKISEGVNAMLFLFGNYMNNDFNRILGIRHRLIANFERFDSAYRRASVRLPKTDFSKYHVPTPREGLINHACIICQSPLLDEDDAAGMPIKDEGKRGESAMETGAKGGKMVQRQPLSACRG